MFKLPLRRLPSRSLCRAAVTDAAAVNQATPLCPAAAARAITTTAGRPPTLARARAPAGQGGSCLPNSSRRPLPLSRAPPRVAAPSRQQQQQQQQQQRRFFSYWDPDGSRLRSARPLFTRDTVRRVAWSPSTHVIVVVAVGGAVTFYFTNLETVPVSGRTRFNVYSPESVRKTSEMQYKMLMYDLERQGARILPDWDPRTVKVRRVMRKLIPFSGMADESWEIFVIDDPHTANAFVLPGGKVFVFSGILPLTRNDDGLAAVLGHEIAHNVADHVAERMSQAIGTNILLYAGILLAAPLGLGPLVMQFIGSKVLDVAFGNPMSRMQESEADYIGLMMMAEACYDPHEAARFWARMDEVEKMGGKTIPEWMSTHPANEARIRKVQEWLPQALEKRQESDCSTTSAFADQFRHALRGQVIRVFVPM
ncbi:peptidase family M48-domain-containing protein [Podospora didyma]|uniref:Peptidase family M48-domain-containing protein n=1 Tax=Podospora didyma TaxID=330526 RepID=A0AAE0K513_9PEZI|nr:peptidase family M48-domain-containing protein [Podospora didyma]